MEGNMLVKHDKNKHLAKRDNIFIALILTLTIGVVCLELLQNEAISDFNYGLHELLALPVNVAIFIVPVQLIMLCYYSTRYFKDIWKATGLMDIKYKIKSLMCVTYMVFIIFAAYYIFNSCRTGGVFTVIDKINDGSKSYLVVENIKIECTKNEFNLVKIDETYIIDYKWNRLKSNVGYLIEIKTMNEY